MFVKGTETREEGQFSFKKYKGLALFKVIAVNPSLLDLVKLFPDKEHDKEPVYEFNREDIKGQRVCFHLQTIPRDGKVPLINTSVSYFLTDAPFTSNDGNKVQVIDIYGNTRWVTREEMKMDKLPPLPPNFKPFGEKWRVAYRGEEGLTRFIRAYLGTPGNCIYIAATKEWKSKEGEMLKAAEGCLEKGDLKSILEGNMKPLREILALMPGNRVKMLMGVKHDQNGRSFQAVHPFPLTGNSNSSSMLARQVEQDQQVGRFQDIDFGHDPFALVEHVEEYTNIKKEEIPGDDNFFGVSSNPVTVTTPKETIDDDLGNEELPF